MTKDNDTKTVDRPYDPEKDSEAKEGTGQYARVGFKKKGTKGLLIFNFILYSIVFLMILYAFSSYNQTYNKVLSDLPEGIDIILPVPTTILISIPLCGHIVILSAIMLSLIIVDIKEPQYKRRRLILWFGILGGIFLVIFVFMGFYTSPTPKAQLDLNVIKFEEEAEERQTEAGKLDERILSTIKKAKTSVKGTYGELFKNLNLSDNDIDIETVKLENDPLLEMYKVVLTFVTVDGIQNMVFHVDLKAGEAEDKLDDPQFTFTRFK